MQNEAFPWTSNNARTLNIINICSSTINLKYETDIFIDTPNEI